jgi:hypothetical protein
MRIYRPCYLLVQKTPTEMPLVSALAVQVSGLKELGLTRVSVDANWLIYLITLLKKQVHSVWQYNSIEDLTRETSDNFYATMMVEL